MSNTSNENFFKTADGLHLYYRDFGKEQPGTPVVCLPGLTRNSRDFEDFAISLEDRRRVITLDFRGRGLSDRDPNWRNYHVQTYVSDLIGLLDSLSVEEFLIVGTSLGGLCAMAIATTHGERLSGVVINDIGPEINPAGLARIQDYTGRLRAVTSWDEAVAQTREIYGDSLPGLSAAQWQKMAWQAYRENDNGVPELDMDSNVGTAVRKIGAQTGDPWLRFDALSTVPTIVLWGCLSDILTEDIVNKMTARNPNIDVIPIANRGHVPLLDEPECVDAINCFLSRVE